MASRALAVAVAALLLVAAGMFGAAVPAQSDGPTDPVRTIDVSASGSASAPPDLAIVRVAVEARADSADTARERVATDVATMRQALRDLGVPEDAVTTTSYSVGPEYDYREGKRELRGYRAVHAFSIESGVDAAGEVIDTAVSNGATAVQGVQFTLSAETREELRREAITEAMASARSDADTIAASAGVSVGPLQTASTANVDYPRPYAAVAEAGGDGGGRTVLEPGPVEVTATVTVSYQIR